MSRLIQWESADRSQMITLTDRAAGYRVMADGTTGLNAPVYRLTTSEYASVDGVTVDAVTAEGREVGLGLLIQGGSEAELEGRVRALTRAMRPQAGPGTLIVSNALGVTRRLGCYYQSGLEGQEDRGSKIAGRWWKFALKFLAEDPWWYGDPGSLSVGLGDSTIFFPIFPLRLSSSVVRGQFSIDLSDTDTPSAPIWTITGPGASLTLTNRTTGKVIQVDAAIGSGEIMVIDTRPGHQEVRHGNGTNLMTYVASDPALWTLIDGVNDVTAALTGAADESRIDGAWVPRYSGV